MGKLKDSNPELHRFIPSPIHHTTPPIFTPHLAPSPPLPLHPPTLTNGDPTLQRRRHNDRAPTTTALAATAPLLRTRTPDILAHEAAIGAAPVPRMHQGDRDRHRQVLEGQGDPGAVDGESVCSGETGGSGESARGCRDGVLCGKGT